jgi:fatty acid desaturase
MSLDQESTASRASEPRGRWGEYTQLSRQIKQAGLLERRRGWYGAKIGLNLALLAAGWAAFVIIGSSWWQLLTAAYLAVVFTQLAFVGHDAGHRQLFRSRRANDLVGLAHANLLVGVSFDWWVDKHNAHHTNPNHEDLDPDISIAALAFTPDQARSKHGLVRLIARYQGWLFFPLLLLEAAHLHLASIKAIVRGSGRTNAIQGLLLAHVAAYVTTLVWVLSPLQAVAFVVVQQGLFGLYLGCSFAPNHKGMPTLTEADQLDFLRRQVLTSRNVRVSRVVDCVLGGLNYQIEHHLFPNMPRPNLRRAQPLIRAFCQDHDLPYTEASLFGSYAEAVRHLHDVGAPLRPAAAAE